MKVKIFKILKEIFFMGLIFIGCATSAAVFSVFFKDFDQIFRGLFSLVIVYYLMLKFLKFVTWLMDELEIKRFKKASTTNKQSLYMWAGEGNVDHFFFYELLKEETKEDTLENLKEIKKKIKNRVGPKTSDYILLKNYLLGREKNSILEKFNTIVLGAIAVVVTTSFSKILNTEKAQLFMRDIFFSTPHQKPVESLQFIIEVGQLLIIFITFLLYIINELTREKRKIESLKGIIDTIIYEKENN